MCLCGLNASPVRGFQSSCIPAWTRQERLQFRNKQELSPSVWRRKEILAAACFFKVSVIFSSTENIRVSFHRSHSLCITLCFCSLGDGCSFPACLVNPDPEQPSLPPGRNPSIKRFMPQMNYSFRNILYNNIKKIYVRKNVPPFDSLIKQ